MNKGRILKSNRHSAEKHNQKGGENGHFGRFFTLHINKAHLNNAGHNDDRGGTYNGNEVGCNRNNRSQFRCIRASNFEGNEKADDG